VIVQGSVGGQTFAPNTNGWIQRRKQRAGLLLSNGSLYVAFSGDNPDPLAGWLFIYDASTLAMKTVWSPTPQGRNGGIWMAGDAPAADSAGDVYLQTGDGDLVPTSLSFGDSIVKLRLQNGAISVAGFFAPCNQMLLKQCDLDQGSAGVVTLPNGATVGTTTLTWNAPGNSALQIWVDGVLFAAGLPASGFARSTNCRAS
jgi:hypothetical protein